MINVKDLAVRTIVAVVAIPLIFGAAIIGRVVFLLFVDIIMVAALLEFYLMLQNKDIYPHKTVGILSLILLSIDFYFYFGIHIILLLVLFIFITLLSELFRKKRKTTENAAVTIFGVFYVGLLLFLLLIRQIPVRISIPYSTGGKLIILIFSVIWICDTSAYIFGSIYGKIKLSPKISPKKTVEGAISSFFAGVVSTLILGYFLIPELTILNFVIIGCIIGSIGQLSDLVESMFKRDARVKDSSNVLLGHGGFLDRFDSSILIGPIIYAYLILFVY